MAILSDGTLKSLSMINALLSSHNVPEFEFTCDKEKTRDQIIELAKKSSTHFLENTNGLAYEEREKLLYSIIDTFKKILGPQLVMDIFKNPIDNANEESKSIKQKDDKFTNYQQTINKQDDVPDVSEIPGLEDLLNNKKK